MAANTAIEWADHTFNPWWGCTKVSPACDHCYAEALARRTGSGHLWQGERRRTSIVNWQLPLRWNRQAEREGRRLHVFCASMADVFDNQVPDEWRDDLWRLIEATPHLDWLLLTKRPQNIFKMRPVSFADDPPFPPWPWPNVWLGTTVENQEEADRRIPHLLSIPAAVRFLSCEPLLGPVELQCVRDDPTLCGLDVIERRPDKASIDWVIAGGESGPGARPSHPDWFRSLRDQCAAADVPFFFKQWGEWGDEDDAFARDAIPDRDGLRIHDFGDGRCSPRIGKRAAGRLLDGREHNAFPASLPLARAQPSSMGAGEGGEQREPGEGRPA